jgi:hypothetical protein
VVTSQDTFQSCVSGMTIRIKRVGDALYSAELTLPDMPAVKAGWSSSEPMSADQLVQELLKRGAHQTDIGDALYQADPDWLRE